MSLRILRVAILLVVLVIGPGAALAAPNDASGVYVVKRGDTLGSIAARNGVSLNALARTNGIANINLIYVGQRLVIPGKSSAAVCCDWSICCPARRYSGQDRSPLWDQHLQACRNQWAGES
jgi:LysM repeat protein